MVATLIAGDRQIDGATVAARAARGVGALDRLGIREGAVIAIMLRNDIAFLEAMMIARLAGCYACPINWHFKADEAGFILRDSGASLLVVHVDLYRQVAAAVPPGMAIVVVRCSPELRQAFGIDAATGDDLAGHPDWEAWLEAAEPYAGPPRMVRSPLYYSSGTTGRPKGIRRDPVTPEYAAKGPETARLAYGIEPGMRTVMVAPLYHSAPASYGMQSAIVGDLAVVRPRLDAEGLLADIERFRITHLYLVPTHFVRLLRLPEDIRRSYDLGSIRHVASTGSPCPPEVKRQMIDWWGPVIYEGYASSETGFITTCAPQDALARPGTAGRVVPGAEVRILDDAGQELPPNIPGAIYCRNRNITEFTYVNNAEARAAIERDGFVSVGDIGYLDEDGYLFVCDRKADMVISGGVNIYPAEIEAALMTLPGVADCAVFGIPDAEFGEALVAHVQPQAGAQLNADDVRAHLRARIADYKVPRLVEFAETLPREESGKIFKRRLREPYWAAAGRRI